MEMAARSLARSARYSREGGAERAAADDDERPPGVVAGRVAAGAGVFGRAAGGGDECVVQGGLVVLALRQQVERLELGTVPLPLLPAVLGDGATRRVHDARVGG